MSKKNDSGKSDQKLPEEVRSLIVRKLRHLRKEQELLLISAKQATYTKLREEVLENVCAQRLGRAFTSVPIEAYCEIANHAATSTKEWPGIA
jgi:hypothetical protein